MFDHHLPILNSYLQELTFFLIVYTQIIFEFHVIFLIEYLNFERKSLFDNANIYIYIYNHVIFIPGHALHEKGLQRQGRRRSTGQQPRRKSARGPADKPRMNRLSTGDFVPAFGLHWISLVRASGETFRRRVFDALGGTRVSCFLGELFCWHPVLPDPAPPPRRAPRPDPPAVCPGFWIRQIQIYDVIFTIAK